MSKPGEKQSMADSAEVVDKSAAARINGFNWRPVGLVVVGVIVVVAMLYVLFGPTP